jgi:hypothetical protein
MIFSYYNLSTNLILDQTACYPKNVCLAYISSSYFNISFVENEPLTKFLSLIAFHITGYNFLYFSNSHDKKLQQVPLYSVFVFLLYYPGIYTTSISIPFMYNSFSYWAPLKGFFD